MHQTIKWILKNKVFIILGFIVLFAFILRVYQLGDSSMWIDETISSLASREILEKGFPMFDSGLFYKRALFFHYLMSVAIFFINNDFGARLISVLFGTASVILSFILAREFGNKNNVAGLTAALFTAVLFLEIAYSRQARFYQMFQFLFFLTLFFLYKSKENKKYALLASITLIFLVDTHLAGLILLPFFVYLFSKEHKDWKLFIIPFLICLYYAPSFSTISTGNKEVITSYIENYSSNLFYHLRAFSIISLLGLPFAWKWNKRLTLILILPSITLLFSLFFVKVYALRYAYFIVLLAPIMISVLFSFIYNSNKIFFTLVLVVAIIYPSNLFFDTGQLTIAIPENTQLYTSSEPIIEYKNLSPSIKEEIMNSKTLVLFTPGFAWYYKNPDYFLSFSLNGLSTGYQIYNNSDSYTGAKKFNFDTTNFIFIEDYFGYSKLNPVEKEKVDKLKENCSLIEEKSFLKIYKC